MGTGKPVTAEFYRVLPLVDPDDLAVGGWDINGADLATAMKRARVLDVDIQRQLATQMKEIKPFPSIYYPEFIAANQSERADNVLLPGGTRAQHLEALRTDIRNFKAQHGLDKVIGLWTANTERFCCIDPEVHNTADGIMAGVENNSSEVSPSTLFGVAFVLEGCSYINGSPQNALVPGLVDLARRHGVFVGGDDFKSGQTKMKSTLMDFLTGAGLKVESIASYNHLGNNDGKNLSAPSQFRSKEISKSDVVDDMVAANGGMYGEGMEKPDHCVVIKYLPHVGDSKRAMDEYTSRICMNGENIISMWNKCEDSLLAVPLILDLVVLTEFAERLKIKVSDGQWQSLDTVHSLLSYLLKAPRVPDGAPVINALFAQRESIVNLARLCRGLPMLTHVGLHNRLPALMQQRCNDDEKPSFVAARA